MRLVDLHPRWIGHGGEGVSDAAGNPIPWRAGIGIIFDCPCGCDTECFVSFTPGLDGQPGIDGARDWNRTGDTFDTLTLRPSILRIRGCPKQWHGYITDGQVHT